MKKLNIIFSALCILTLAACGKERDTYGGQQRSEKEVEISISTSPQKTRGTRSSVKDPGSDGENLIRELDLLVFGSDGDYKYRREAAKLNTGANNYRAMLLESQDELTVYLFANCRGMLESWESRVDRGSTWEQVQAQLKDLTPERLVNSAVFQPLPMWGMIKGTLSAASAPSKWGSVQMLRSVASADVYVEKNAKTADFELTDMYVYYAPDRGFLAPLRYGADVTSPEDMTTSLTDQLHANGVRSVSIMGTDNVQTDARAISHQMYFYDNDAVVTGDDDRRPSRMVIAGYYKQEPPLEGDPDTRVKSYYPIDFVFSDGRYRPLKRNWKYEFKVYAVNGPGKPSITEAARSHNTDLNLEIIQWDKEQVEIGVEGNYYVSMVSREIFLSRDAGATGKRQLVYRINDDLEHSDFTVSFKDERNGEAETLAGGGVANDYFEVTLVRTGNASGGTVDVCVKALHDFTEGHGDDVVVIKFRRLKFEIAIHQLDREQSDWNDGGDVGTDL